MKRYLSGKSTVIAVVLLAIIGFCHKIHACDRYAEFGGGYPYVSNTDQEAFNYYVNGIVGRRYCTPFGCPLRAELEARYSREELSTLVYDFGRITHNTLSVNSFSLFANGLIDLPTYSRWTPYVGAGIGYGYSHVSMTDPLYGRSVLQWCGLKNNEFTPLVQGIIGMKYALTPSCYLKADYRSASALFNTANIDKIQNVGVGIGIGF